MAEKKCERCGKVSHGMTILTYCEKEHETICTDCYNDEMAEYYEIEDFRDFVKSYTSLDSDGVSHTFDINKRIMGTGVFWEAVEANDGKFDGYKFEVDAEMDGDQHEAVQKLYSKIHKGLQMKYIETKTLEGHKVYSLYKDEIVGRIEWDSDNGTVFIIDGKKYSLKEFGKIMNSREGFNFKLMIYDPTEDIE